MVSLWIWHASEARWAVAPGDAARGELLVADSWVVSDGRVRGWFLHMDRFVTSCVASGAERSSLEHLVEQLPALMPESEAWFPRLEMRSGAVAEFHLRLRPCPDRWETAVVWPTGVDPRMAPRVKGPDIDRLMRLRAEAREHGADEAVILNRRGEPIEAAGCSIVWWQDGALQRVPDSEPILDGVTRRLLAGLAGQSDVRIAEAAMPVARLAEHEAWLVNALIGIVPITRWVGHGDRAPVDPDRLETWRSRLDELAIPVAGGSPA